MRRACVLAGIVAGVLGTAAFVGPVTADGTTIASSPTAGAGTDGFEQCAASGQYSTNRSESYLAVSRAGQLLGESKFFFSSPYEGAMTDWSQVYRFHLGTYQVAPSGVGNQLLPGYDCVTGPAQDLPAWDDNTDPNLAFDYQGNAYSTVLAFNWDNNHNAIYVSKKPVGQAWQRPVLIDEFDGNRGLGRLYDKQWVAADANPPCQAGQTHGCSPFSGNVYAAWTIFGNQTGQIYFSRSTDNGTTFSPPQLVSQFTGPFNTFVYLSVDSQGTLYLEYTDFGKKFSTFGTAEVRVSTDGGLTFSKPYTGPSFQSEPLVARTNFGNTLPNTTFRDGITDYFTASQAHPGTLWIVDEQWDLDGCKATSSPSGDYDVGVWRSTNRGQTWTELGCANDPSTQGDATDQFQPEVATDAQGHVAVAWYDRRNACPTTQPAGAPGYYTEPGATNYCIQTGLQWYNDATGAKVGSNVLLGPSWDPQQPANEAAPVGSPAGYVSDLPSPLGPCYSSGIPICVTFIGDYFGLAVFQGMAYTLNVSTYPTYQHDQTVADWSQAPTVPSISPRSVAPAVNDYYQQQVLNSATAPF